MSENLRAAIERGNLFEVLDCIQDRTEELNREWAKVGHENVENKLHLAIQEIENIKVLDTKLEMNIVYHLGRLDGFISAYEKVYRAERQLVAATEELSEQSPKAIQIIQCLYERGSMCHCELAKAINSSYSSLTNIMKRVLLSGAVRSARSGKNTIYYLTETGKCYYESHPKQDEEKLVRIVSESIRKVLNERENLASPFDSFPIQQLRVGDKVYPICNDDVREPVQIKEISIIGSYKYLKYAACSNDTSEEKKDISPVMLYSVGMMENMEEVK